MGYMLNDTLLNSFLKMSFRLHAKSVSGFGVPSSMHGHCGKPRRQQTRRPSVQFHD